MPPEYASNTKQQEAASKAIDLLRHGKAKRYKEIVTEENGDEFRVNAYWALNGYGGIRIDITSNV